MRRFVSKLTHKLVILVLALVIVALATSAIEKRFNVAPKISKLAGEVAGAIIENGSNKFGNVNIASAQGSGPYQNISGDVNISGALQLQGASSANRSVFSTLNFYNTVTPSSNIQAQIKGIRGMNNYKAGQLGFFTAAADATGTLSEKMTIDENGNVGIGTATPNVRLDVQKSETTGTNSVLGQFKAIPTNNGGSAIFRLVAGTYSSDFEQNQGGTGPFRYGTYLDTNIVNNYTSALGPFGNINFVTNGGIKMMLTGGNGAGSLGIINSTAAPISSQSLPGSFNLTGYGWNTLLGSRPIAGQVLLSGGYSAITGSVEPHLSFSLQGTGGFASAGPSTLTERMRVTNTGNVGIGTTNPIGPLAVGDSSVDGSDGYIVIGKRAATATRHYKIGFDSSFNFVIGDYGSSNQAATWTSPFAIAWNAPSNSLYIQNTGNVGIGTNLPGAKLDLGQLPASTEGLKIKIGANPATNWAPINIINATNAYVFRVKEDGTVCLGTDCRAASLGWPAGGGTSQWTTLVNDIYYNTGNVGIGTSTPDTKLEIATADSTSLLTNAGTLRLSSAAPQVDFVDSDNNDWAIHANSNRLYFIREPWNYSDLVLDGTGKVGIGTATPLGTLHTAGEIQSRTTTSTDGYVGLVPGGTGSAGYIQWFKPTTPTPLRLGYLGWSSGGVNNLGLNLENSANFIINGGNVGVGTNTPGANMQINPATGVEGLRIVSATNWSPLNIRNNANNADIFRVDQTGSIVVGIVPWARLSSFPTACGAGQYVSGIGAALTCSTPPGGITTETDPTVTAFGKTLNQSVNNNSSPTFASLSVGGTGVITQGGDNVYANIRVLRNTSTNLTWQDGLFLGYGGSGGPIRFYSNSGTTEFMTLTTGGNLGIGTGSPTQKLEVAGNIEMGRNHLHLNNDGGSVATDSEAGIYWHVLGSGAGADYAIYRTPGAWTASTYQQLKLDWPTGIILEPGTGNNVGYDKSYVEITGGKGLRVTQGNVSIGGVSNPTHPLEVKDIDGYIATLGGAGLGGNRPYFYITNTSATGDLQFQTNNITRMTIGSTGNTTLTGTVTAPTFVGNLTGSVTGNATSATSATYATYINTDSFNMKLHWAGQVGQPTWLWGSNNGTDAYVWNPSNFNVNYANSAGIANDVPAFAKALNQSVNTTSSPTFASLAVGGTVTTEGLITFRGNDGQYMRFNKFVNGSNYIEFWDGEGGGSWGITAFASSKAIKKNITDLTIDTNKIYELKPYSYNYKTDSNGAPKTFGLMAEDVARTIPELVAYDAEDKPHHVNLDSLSVLLLNEMQKQKVEKDKENALIQYPNKISLNDAGFNTYEVKGSNGNLVSRISAFAQLVVAKIQAGVIETKKLVVDGIDILERLNTLTQKVDAQQKEIDALKIEINNLKK